MAETETARHAAGFLWAPGVRILPPPGCLLPYTPDQLLAMARQDFERVLAMESYEHQRDLRAPELKIAATAEEETARMAQDDANIRRYLTEHQILTVLPIYRIGPSAWRRTTSRPWMGSANWTISPDRRVCIRMECAGSSRPRTICLTSGKHTRKIREQRACTKASRDISSNCRWPGEIPTHPPAVLRFERQRRIGFYAEEMMLDAGLYDDSPRSREIIYNLRACGRLRVEVDVKLASAVHHRPSGRLPGAHRAHGSRNRRRRSGFFRHRSRLRHRLRNRKAANRAEPGRPASRAGRQVFASASFTTPYGATATCRYRSNAGKRWVWTMT